LGFSKDRLGQKPSQASPLGQAWPGLQLQAGASTSPIWSLTCQPMQVSLPMLNTSTAHSELLQSTNSLRIFTSTAHNFSKKISDSEEKTRTKFQQSMNGHWVMVKGTRFHYIKNNGKARDERERNGMEEKNNTMYHGSPAETPYSTF
jgi:hypothetical protein